MQAPGTVPLHGDLGYDPALNTEGLQHHSGQSSLSLRWPKHHSNTAAITALEKPTMRSRLFHAAGDGE